MAINANIEYMPSEECHKFNMCNCIRVCEMQNVMFDFMNRVAKITILMGWAILILPDSVFLHNNN